MRIDLSRALFALLSLTLLAGFARADVTFEITGVGARQFPIAVSAFTGESGLKEPLTEVIRADLERSGRFKLVDSGSAPVAENAMGELANWKSRGADSLATGSVRIEADGSAAIRLRLYDAVNSRQLVGVEVRSRASDLRRTAHQLADLIYETLTGDRGVFATRIAFVLKQGARYSLQVADADGHNPQTVMASNEPILSPTWSADGGRLAYVSFERKKPIVFVQDLYAGSRKPVAAFKGSNSAPAFSPDGRTLAVTLTLDGISQLYRVPAGGGEAQRLMRTPAIDTEASFSPDGSQIAFTSDRGGSPQIYLVGAGGGEAQRVSFEGNYNVSPQFSPDGKTLAFVRRENGRFVVATLDLASRQTLTLTNGTYDESPSFAPNGKLILYATETGGRGTLATVSIDGQVKQRLSVDGNAREPAWGPFPAQLAVTRLSSNP
ncbi:Tol-Pal system beta propeller repeat protein TolB [Chitinimonas koreensis]|uniref:Tol-Pal system beta propeller repeat protein TolB n=1 Tax=Chitinimonas koreensis TaxID=356302 RepID=UPI000419709B|nr:Tol-Pal system beta propeller repeat protein TolB [Chitinimonas koreensis]QNM96557.1 Tol-Pal system protein TolB [Chitinimonas koreensis]